MRGGGPRHSLLGIHPGEPDWALVLVDPSTPSTALPDPRCYRPSGLISHWADPCHRYELNLPVGDTLMGSKRRVQQEDLSSPSFALAVRLHILAAVQTTEQSLLGVMDYQAFHLDDGVIACQAPAARLILAIHPNRCVSKSASWSPQKR